MGSSLGRCCGGGWCTSWSPSEELKTHYPPRHSDFRDSAPEPLSTIYDLYQPVVQEGRWTEGLLEMWWRKNKPVKHSVHIPCWDSFKWNPLKWRGPCFGRTLLECYWTGLRQTRWARYTYAANLGREYVLPVRNIGRHGYKSDIKALCWMFYIMSCIFSCGIGQILTCCGSSMVVNFAACYSCHARERMRRRYKLPPSFCMPPGIDDCLVHFFCFYCASHQEMRELALRGIDGPGMHILDVLPNSFPKAEGIEEAKAERKKLLEGMLKHPPKLFISRPKPEGKLAQAAAEWAASLAEHSPLEGEEEEVGLAETPLEGVRQTDSGAASHLTDDEFGGGWMHYYSPPSQQEMRRAVSLTSSPGTTYFPRAAGRRAAAVDAADLKLERRSERMVPVVQEEPALHTAAEHQVELRRWSVAY